MQWDLQERVLHGEEITEKEGQTIVTFYGKLIEMEISEIFMIRACRDDSKE